MSCVKIEMVHRFDSFANKIEENLLRIAAYERQNETIDEIVHSGLSDGKLQHISPNLGCLR